VEQTARRHHEAASPALVGTAGSYSYREAADRMWRLARALRELGVGPGDRVAILAANSPDYLLLFAAISALGAATVPMSPRWTATEVADAVAYVRPAVLVTSAAHAAVAQQAAPARLAVLDLADDPEAPVWLAFTGGTTGTMKACVVDAATFTENILFCSLQFGFGREDVTLACGSYGHMLPLYFSLLQRGLVLMREYLDHPELTSEIISADGWATAGDMGRLDEEGYLYLVDRKKDMIISGGVNVYPNEIEEILLAVPGADEVAVIGIPHERWGEAVHAVVVLTPGTDPQDWQSRARGAAAATLAGYKRPKSYAVADALPRAHSGKLLKREIRAPYWETPLGPASAGTP
jgi:acyl-CoA synthetase (AMP-forming)/AMP-acid ligase II